jgi:hypothetical protein
LTASLINWNHFINRVLLVPLLLLIPIVAVAFEDSRPLGTRAGRIIVPSLLLSAVGWAILVMLFNPTNRLISAAALPESLRGRNVGYWNTSYDDLRFRILVPQMEAPASRIAQVVRSKEIRRVGLHVRVGDFPVYPLLARMGDREHHYVRANVLPGRISSDAAAPEAVVEVLSKADYSGRYRWDPRRGTALLPPQEAGDAMILLYTPPR